VVLGIFIQAIKVLFRISIVLAVCLTAGLTCCGAPSGAGTVKTETSAAAVSGAETAAETSAASDVPNPIVTIRMKDGGVIRAELYPAIAPNTVNNFISLINKGYYNGVCFHRVIRDFMIQGGSSNGQGNGNPGYSIAGEFTENGFRNDLNHTRGVLSMARGNAPDSAGSQFFIMHGDADWLDGKYAAFGKVIEGMDVVDRIAEGKTDANDRPLEDQIMEEVTVETFGTVYPEPEKH